MVSIILDVSDRPEAQDRLPAAGFVQRPVWVRENHRPHTVAEKEKEKEEAEIMQLGVAYRFACLLSLWGSGPD